MKSGYIIRVINQPAVRKPEVKFFIFPDEMYGKVIERMDAQMRLKDVQSELRQYDNEVKQLFIENEACMIDFGKDGKVEYRPWGKSFVLKYKIETE